MSSISRSSRIAVTARRSRSSTSRRTRRSTWFCHACDRRGPGLRRAVGQVPLVVRADPVDDLVGRAEPGRDLRQRRQRDLRRPDPRLPGLVGPRLVTGEPGPPDHHRQRQALDQHGDHDDHRGDEDDQVAVLRTAAVVQHGDGTASAAASETAPRKPAQPLAVRTFQLTRRARWAGRRSTRRMNHAAACDHTSRMRMTAPAVSSAIPTAWPIESLRDAAHGARDLEADQHEQAAVDHERAPGPRRRTPPAATGPG